MNTRGNIDNGLEGFKLIVNHPGVEPGIEIFFLAQRKFKLSSLILSCFAVKLVVEVVI
jgi:hypothetical protein